MHFYTTTIHYLLEFNFQKNKIQSEASLQPKCTLQICVRRVWSAVLPSFSGNRSGIGLNMAARSLVHHTSQPQPLSADYKLQSWLQIMTKDVLARLVDAHREKTHWHTLVTCDARNRSLEMRQFINKQSINNQLKEDVETADNIRQGSIWGGV